MEYGKLLYEFLTTMVFFLSLQVVIAHFSGAKKKCASIFMKFSLISIWASAYLLTAVVHFGPE